MIAGAISAYTTRYFINGDAIAYFDMADAFGRQAWADMLNLHYSPGYAMLLSLITQLSGAGSANELFVSKILNFLCYVVAIAGLEMLLHQLETDEDFASVHSYQPIDWILFRMAVYGLFLLCSLVYIRIQVVSPDMLECCFALCVAAVLVWIKKSGDSMVKFVILGLVTGLGYLCKTPFFPLSVVFFVLAALYAGSVGRAFTRVLVALLVFLLVSSSLYVPMSYRVGRVSIGESGNYNYAHFVSGSGRPVHPPVHVWHKPPVEVYAGGSNAATFPKGFDLSYWNEGVKPSFDLSAQLSVFFHNLWSVFALHPWLHVLVLAWLLIQARMGACFSVKFRRPSVPVLLGVMSVAGTGLFCLVLVESRYVAPYVFLGLVGMLSWPRCGPNQQSALAAARVGMICVVALLIGTVLVSMWDQTERSLYDRDTKQSYRNVFLQNVAVRDYLERRGVSKGHRAAILGKPSIGIYWARLAGVKAIATIADQAQFLEASPQDRTGALDTLKTLRFKVILGSGQAVARLEQEGWSHVPGTSDSFVRFLE